MKKRLEALKKNKKGFSLIELIIVIAIMAILIGIVASQVLPYMEKSRKAKDQQQLSSICTSVATAIAQTNDTIDSIGPCDLSGLGSSTAGGNLGEKLKEAFNNQAPADFAKTVIGKFKSKAYKNAITSADAAAGKGISISYDGKTVMVYVNGYTSDSALMAESE